MNLRTYRSFSTELTKIAAEILDPDIRELIADRRGEYYLSEGKLETSKTVSPYSGETKTAGAAGAFPSMPPDVYTPTSRQKGPTAYQNARDYGMAGLKGALTGSAALHLGANMINPKRTPVAGAYRNAALIGGGLSLLDRAIRHREYQRFMPGQAVKQAGVDANPNAGFNSPADALNSAQTVGSFRAGSTHRGGVKVPTIGQKFRI